jgi:ethanolamine ammonia-lyase small subunit
MSTSLIPNEPWSPLRRHTQARIALGRAGGSLPTRATLAFAHDHALARDAVWEPFDSVALAHSLRETGQVVWELTSQAPDRATYLQRPDLGRALSNESRMFLEQQTEQQGRDLVIVISDGLSAQAAMRQAVHVVTALLPLLKQAGFTVAPICVVRHARVALQDEVGELLKSRLSLILLGERPGLATPDSLGAYFLYEPRVGKSNALRNCLSNIRPEGLPPMQAAEKLCWMLREALQLQVSGVELKEPEGEASLPNQGLEIS